MPNLTLQLVPDSHSSFTAQITDAIRILKLGQALPRAVPGSLSARDGEGFFAGEVGYGTPDDVAVTLADAAGVAGNGGPDTVAAETLALHAAVYRMRGNAGAVIILRAPRLATWAVAGRALPVRYFQMFGYTKAQALPVSAAYAASLARTLVEHPDTPAVLLDDGRTVIWSGDAKKAVRLVLSLEEAALVTGLAERIGGAKDYPAAAREKIYSSLKAQARQ